MSDHPTSFSQRLRMAVKRAARKVTGFLARRRRAAERSRDTTVEPHGSSRRELLGGLGILPFLGAGSLARKTDSPNHDEYHDHEETVAFMQDVKVPWIAFKVLAAGAIPAKDGIQYAFDSGADFICLGMFDFQVEQDARLVRECVAKAKNRKRPWA